MRWLMDLDFINAALTIMGLEAMADPNNPIGRVQLAAKRMHLDVRREVLELNRWTSGNSVAKIEPETGGLVPPDYAYVGLLPADYLGMWRADAAQLKVLTVGDTPETAQQRIAWCGDAAIVVDYQRDVPYAMM